MSYGALALGIDMKYGKHSFSVKTASGDSDDLMPGSDYPFTGWSHTDTNDRSETSFNYSYKLNNNWSVALGLYEGENEMEFTNNRTIDTQYSNSTIGLILKLRRKHHLKEHMLLPYIKIKYQINSLVWENRLPRKYI